MLIVLITVHAKSTVSSVISIENLKTLKHNIFLIQYWFFLLFVVSMAVKMNKKLKKKNQLIY